MKTQTSLKAVAVLNLPVTNQLKNVGIGAFQTLIQTAKM